ARTAGEAPAARPAAPRGAPAPAGPPPPDPEPLAPDAHGPVVARVPGPVDDEPAGDQQIEHDRPPGRESSTRLRRGPGPPPSRNPGRVSARGRARRSPAAGARPAAGRAPTPAPPRAP